VRAYRAKSEEFFPRHPIYPPLAQHAGAHRLEVAEVRKGQNVASLTFGMTRVDHVSAHGAEERESPREAADAVQQVHCGSVFNRTRSERNLGTDAGGLQ